MKIFTLTEKNFTSNCYIIATNQGNAIIVDPNDFVAAERLLLEKSLTLRYVLLTHEHYDHICGLGELKERCAKAVVIASQKCSEALPFVNEKKERFRLYLHYMGRNRNMPLKDCHIHRAEIEFTEDYELEIDDCFFYLKSVAGHSEGSIIIFLNHQYLFSGDSLLLEKDIVVKFSGGNPQLYETKTKPYLMSLDKDLTVLPGHGRIFPLWEKRF